MSAVHWLVGKDRDGLRVARDPDTGLLYRLTECCGASVTGSFALAEPIVCCRKCYREVDGVFASSVSEDEIETEDA